MSTENHTHEIRYHDYRKGNNHSEVLCKGTQEECNAFLKSKAADMECGVGLLLNNCGYSFVSLEYEAQERIKAAAPELLSALKSAYDMIMDSNYNNACIRNKVKDEIRNAIYTATKS